MYTQRYVESIQLKQIFAHNRRSTAATKVIVTYTGQADAQGCFKALIGFLPYWDKKTRLHFVSSRLNETAPKLSKQSDLISHLLYFLHDWGSAITRRTTSHDSESEPKVYLVNVIQTWGRRSYRHVAMLS